VCLAISLGVWLFYGLISTKLNTVCRAISLSVWLVYGLSSTKPNTLQPVYGLSSTNELNKVERCVPCDFSISLIVLDVLITVFLQFWTECYKAVCFQSNIVPIVLKFLAFHFCGLQSAFHFCGLQSAFIFCGLKSAFHFCGLQSGCHTLLMARQDTLFRSNTHVLHIHYLSTIGLLKYNPLFRSIIHTLLIHYLSTIGLL